MKKFLIAIVSAILVFATLLCGCDCSGCSSYDLEFSPLFYGASGEPKADYVQQTTYDVSLKNSYGNDIKKNDSLDQLINYDYSGTYTSTLTVLPGLPNNIPTDMKEEIQNSSTYIYKLETSLNLKFTYTISGKAQQENQDFINTQTIFAPAKSGFIPIYTTTNSSVSYISIEENGANVQKLVCNNSVLYNNDNYVMTTKYDNQSPTTVTYDYTRQTLIDNSQLLFVMRNINLLDKEQYELPVVSYQYGEQKNVMITNDGVGTTQLPVEQGSLMINGEDFNKDNISVKRYKFRLSEDKNMGVDQFVYIQNGECGNLENRSLMYRYVEPLYTLGTNNCLGVLEYTLKEVSIENN